MSNLTVKNHGSGSGIDHGVGEGVMSDEWPSGGVSDGYLDVNTGYGEA